MNPASGRFTQQDSFEGRKKRPTTINKYIYADSDAVNRLDPSGNMSILAVSGGAFGNSLRVGSASVTLNTFTRFSVRLLLAVGTTMIGGSTVNNEKVKERARSELFDAVRAIAIARARNMDDTLFHYTSAPKARQILAEQSLRCTGRYRGHLGGGVTHPAGAYATDIAPWNPFTTDRMLRAFHFGGNMNFDLTWFVAVNGEEFSPVYGAPHEYVRQCPHGEYVPVEVYYAGPSLLDP